jgi:uncharacterized protein with beta-barrel porin domain
MRKRSSKFGLLASSSLAALFVGAGAPLAFAAGCQVTVNASSAAAVSNPNAINCIFISNSTVTGNVTNANTGVITPNGANSPTGIRQSGGLISGDILLSANANNLFISGGTINGNIAGPGGNTLNRIFFELGKGTFTYGSAFGFSGISDAVIESGTVILNGTNSSALSLINAGTLQIGDAAHPGATFNANIDVGVNQLGTLSGHGTINGAVVVHGTLMPGGSIGTLTINGNLDFLPIAGTTPVYAIEVAPGQASNTLVNGFAKVSGANVNAIVTAPLGFVGPQTSNVLTATTPLGAGNTFNPAVTLTPGVLPASEKITFNGAASLSYDANDVFLSLPSYTVTLVTPPGGSLNAQNAVNALNTFILAGGSLPAGFQNLGGLTGNAFNTAATQLGGQTQGSFVPVGLRAGDMFLKILLDPYVEGRGGSGAILPYAPQSQSAPAADAFSALAQAPKAIFDPRMSVWAAAYGGDGTIGGNAFTGAANTNSQIYGLATGLDYRISPDTIFGIALGGGGTSWQLGQGLGAGQSGMFQSGAFGTTHVGPAYVSGALAYSLHEVTTNRNVTLAGFDSL